MFLISLIVASSSLSMDCTTNNGADAIWNDLSAIAEAARAPLWDGPPGTTLEEPEQLEEPEEPEQSVVESTPYYNQYDNDINKGGSCQNTSIAMVLGLYGADVSPDDISRRFGTRKGQTPEGVAEIFNIYAAEYGLGERMEAERSGSFSELKAILDEGKPVIINGYFTRPGHVIVVTGYDENGYFVNDPAGVWNETWKGGYQGSYDGRGVHYDNATFETAVGTLDGRTPEPLWYGKVQN